MPAPAMPYFSVPFDDVQPVAAGPALASGADRAGVTKAPPPAIAITARAAVTAYSFLFPDMKALLGAELGTVITTGSLRPPVSALRGQRQDGGRGGPRHPGPTGRGSGRGAPPTRAPPRRGRPSRGRSRRP